MNWVVFSVSSLFLWAFVIGVLAVQCDPETDESCKSANSSLDEFKKWQHWISQNFTWLYIGTQWAWGIFVVWIGFSKYGDLKLGKNSEKPVFNDVTWFSMLFCSGIGVGVVPLTRPAIRRCMHARALLESTRAVRLMPGARNDCHACTGLTRVHPAGLYFYGVSEPMSYYRLNSWGGSYENRLFKVPFQNDDQRAQQAIFMTLYHWGVHAWGCYILVALLLGFVAFRWDMPMTLRCASRL